MPAADAPGQEERLVETPLAQTAGVEGNGDHEAIVSKRKIRVPVPGQEVAQRLGQTGMTAVFKLGQDGGDQAFIMSPGPGSGEMAVSPQAIRAKVVFSEVTGEVDAAAGTAGMSHLANLAETGRADSRGILLFPAFRTEGTPGGKEEVDQGLPPRSHLYGLSG